MINLLRVSNKARRMEFDKELLLKLPNSPSNILQHSIHLFYSKNYTESLALLNDLLKQLECEEDKSDVKFLIGLVANQARDQRTANGTLAKVCKISLFFRSNINTMIFCGFYDLSNFVSILSYCIYLVSFFRGCIFLRVAKTSCPHSGLRPLVGKSYLGFSKFEHSFPFTHKQQQTFITRYS